MFKLTIETLEQGVKYGECWMLGWVALWIKALQREAEVSQFKYHYTRPSNGLSNPTSLQAPGDLWVKIVENAVINIGLMRLSLQEWPKVCRGTAK